MRLTWLLLVLILALAACSTDGDDSTSEHETPTATAEATSTAAPDTSNDERVTPDPDPTPDNGDPSELESTDLQAVVDRVAEQVSELRGLELLEDLDASIMTQDELREFLEEEMVFDPVEIELFWMLRLLDEREFELVDELIEMQVREIQGFYNAETKELFVIAEDENLTPLKRVFLAHEIVHALQDQHFDLMRLETYLPDRDRSMAFRSMIEGDATLTQEMYVEEYLSTRQQFAYLREALGMLRFNASAETMEQLPRYFVETFTFPYFSGVDFMFSAFDGDLSALDEFIENPPSSTQQVMNPEAYLAGDIPDPLDVEAPEILERLDGDWEEVLAGTLGTLDLLILLEENGALTVDEAIDGWAGTEFVMYADGDDLLTVLATRWVSEADAAEFEAALIQTMTGYPKEEGVWIGEDRYFAIVSSGDTVNLKSSTDPDALVDAAQLN